MRITLLTVGTEGDVRPICGLGQALAAAGHLPTVATGGNFSGLVQAAGLRFAPLEADIRQLMQEVRSELAAGGIRLMRAALSRLAEVTPSWASQGMEAAEGADLLIGTGGATYLASSIAEKRRIPFVRVNLQPLEPNRRFGPLLFEPTRIPLPGVVRLGLHGLTRQLTWQLGRRAVDGLRGAIGLEPYPRLGPWRVMGAGPGPILNGFSPVLVPEQERADGSMRTVGPWTLRDSGGFQPPEDLKRFLAEGPPPVFVGFGSMVSEGGGRAMQMAVAAARSVGQRVVLSGGWGGFDQDVQTSGVTDFGRSVADVLAVGSVPHDWLFPRMAVVVHHCGAGTTAAAAAAGVPTVPVPFLLDQFFWASRLRALGVGSVVQSRGRLSVERFAAAIREATGERMRERARLIAERLACEDPGGDAIQALNEWGVLDGQRNPGGART